MRERQGGRGTAAVLRAGLMVLVVGAMAADSAAQTPARSFDELRARVKNGETVTLTDQTGREVTGKVAALSHSGLTLSHGGGTLTLMESQVSLVQHRQSDSLLNGVLIGAAVGGVPAYLLVAAANCHDCRGFALFWAAIGAGIGLGVDGYVRSNRTVFLPRANGRQASRLRVSPLVTLQRQGVVASFGF